MFEFDRIFTVEPASRAADVVAYVHRILREGRTLVIGSRPLEATSFEVDGVRCTYVFHQLGLSVRVLYTLAEGGK